MATNASDKATAGRALAGRCVVVTRAAEQNQELARELTAAGAEVLLLPLVRFLDPRDTRELDEAIAELDSFDWLIFTSANAVQFFLRRCGERGSWPSAGRPRIAVVGPATREALEREGLRAERMPDVFGGAAVAAELGCDVAGKRVLLPRSDRAGDDLPAALRTAGATVTEVVAYRTAAPETLDSAVIEALRRGEADAITFFSPSAFQHFAKTLGTAGVSGMVAAGVIFAAVGPTTAAAMCAAGVPVTVEAAAATSASLIAALEGYFAKGAHTRGSR